MEKERSISIPQSPFIRAFTLPLFCSTTRSLRRENERMNFNQGQAISFLLVLICRQINYSICDACDCKHADFVPTLPGFDQPTPSRWYSGYVSYELYSRTIYTHYVLVEAEQNYIVNDRSNNTEKPLIYWSNGGPGASSLFGLLTELGPLQLSDASLNSQLYKTSGIPSLIYNPYTWTRLGSVLIFDQPAPVGFSYCNDDAINISANANKDCSQWSWTDESAADNTFFALQAFYDKFPCYGNRDLYLAGESYAGIYIPTLARRILSSNTSSTTIGVTNNGRLEDSDDRHDIKSLLKGVTVGDGCLGTETAICGDLSSDHRPDLWRVLFLAGHGQIPFSTLQHVMQVCQHNRTSFFSSLPLHPFLIDEPACQAALDLVNEQVGSYYEYALYDDCIYRNLAKSSLSKYRVGYGGLNDYSCGGYPAMVEWLNRAEVRHALHVHGDFFSVDNAQDFDYTPTEPDLTSFFHYLATETNIRVMVYNGDTDPAITSLAARNWTRSIGLGEVQGWRPWSIDHCRRIGGYVTRYEGDFDFLTIRGSGHMVPTYKAEATFTFMKAWMENQDFPRYEKSCTKPVSASSTTLRAAFETAGDINEL